MTISEAISTNGINALLEATTIGKDKLKDQFKSATIKRLTKSGYIAEVEDKSGKKYKVNVKKNGKSTVINFS